MWAIALKNGHAAMFWNGEVFKSDDTEAVRFFSKELAEKVLNRVFCREEPTDQDDWDFQRKLYAQVVA